jgi:hypothetical protein
MRPSFGFVAGALFFSASACAPPPQVATLELTSATAPTAALPEDAVVTLAVERDVDLDANPGAIPARVLGAGPEVVRAGAPVELVRAERGGGFVAFLPLATGGLARATADVARVEVPGPEASVYDYNGSPELYGLGPAAEDMRDESGRAARFWPRGTRLTVVVKR